MKTLTEWLEHYRTYLSTEAFLAALSPQRGEVEGPAEANEFFDSLLAPIEDLSLSTKAWSTYFVTEEPLEELGTTPQGAIAFLLRGVAKVPVVPAAEAAMLAEAYIKAGKTASSVIAVAVAYLGRDRRPMTLSLLFGACVRDQQLGAAREVLKEMDLLLPNFIETRFCRSILDVSEGDVSG